MKLSEWGIGLAREKLSTTVPRRWAHVQGVVERAEEVKAVAGGDGALLIAAAASHEIGHAPDVRASGFVALDGARFLQRIEAPARLVNLVANYTYARLEAELRGFGPELAEFQDEQTPVRDALWYCDLTTGPDGERMTFDERVAEWSDRYAQDEVIEAFTKSAYPELRAACERTEQRLQATRTAGRSGS